MDRAQNHVDPRQETSGDVWTTLLDTFKRIRKHWQLFLAVAGAIILGVTFYTLGQKKIYGSSATIIFDPNPPKPLGNQVETVVDMGAGSYWNNREYYETQYKLMRSMRTALAVVQDLNLHHDAGFIQNVPPGGKQQPAETSPEAAAWILISRSTVTPGKNSRLAYFSYEDADPQRAQRIATAMADKYVELNLDDALASTNSAVEWLNGQLDKLKTGLDSSEMALHEYKLHKNILSADIDAQSNMLREEMKQFNDAVTATRIKREELAARSQELQRIPGDNPAAVPATELLQSSLLSTLRTNFVEATRERDSLKASGKGAQHPDVLGAGARVENARKALLAEIKNIQGAVERDLAIVRRQEAGLAGLFEGTKKKALDLNLLEIEYNRLLRSKQNNEKLYQIVMERSKESDLSRMLRVNNIRVIDRPQLVTLPVRPNVSRNIMLGGLIAVALGITAAFVRDLLDRTIKSQVDVESAVGLTFLGILPMAQQGSQKSGYYYGRGRRGRHSDTSVSSPEMVVHEAPMSGVAEAARSIRTNIQFMSPDEPFRALLITSAGPSEGKTTVTSCVATAMAQAGLRVLIVDCDLRRPRVHRVFKLSNELGLSGVLLDASKLAEAVLETRIPNLFVMPSGPLPPNPAELLQSDRFAKILAELKERFDRVIIDSPPVAPVTDAAILSTRVDGTVLVFKAFGTAREAGRQARRSIQDVGGRILGAVLNAVDLRKSEYQHYYYYASGGYYTEAKVPPAGGETTI